MRRRAGVAVALGMLAVLAHGADAGAQGPDEVRASCLAAAGDAPTCARASVATRALLGDMGLAAGLGSEVPGSASTLGHKMGSRPRLAWSVRASAVRASFPDFFHEAVGPAPARSFLTPGVQVGVAAGVFDGFSPARTVGGVLSLDLLGSFALLMPPSSHGFVTRVDGLTFGVRAGLVRESFTLPGMSVSVSRRFLGDVRVGDTDLGDPVAVTVDPTITSVRATVGKDLFGVGFLAGMGRDHLGGAVGVRLAGAGGARPGATASLDAHRDVYFGGLALHFLLLHLALEAGWAEGFDDAPLGAPVSAFDVGRGSAFASLALRLTP